MTFQSIAQHDPDNWPLAFIRDVSEKPVLISLVDPEMSIKAKILQEIMRIAAQHSKTVAPLNDNLPLANSGLDSLCIAILVASLHDKLGVDPFDRDGTVPLPMTIGDFAELYENAAA